MTWPAPGEEPVVKTIILDDKSTAKKAARRWATEKEAKVGAESGRGGPMDHALMKADWEQQRCASTVMNGGPAAVIWALDGWMVFGAELWAIELALGEPVKRRNRLQQHGVKTVAVFSDSQAPTQ
jgi:hypothetical protein